MGKGENMKMREESPIIRLAALLTALLLFGGLLAFRRYRTECRYRSLTELQTSPANPMKTGQLRQFTGIVSGSVQAKGTEMRRATVSSTFESGTSGPDAVKNSEPGAAQSSDSDPNPDDQIANRLEPMYYNLSSAKLNHPDLLKQLLDDQTILFLGSSELSSIGEGTHPIQFYNDGYHDFELLLLGRGYTQSLFHAVNVGAMAGQIPNRKVVLNLSPQWFTEAHLQPEAFASVFQMNQYAAMLTNPNLSDAFKQRLSERCRERLGYSGSVYDAVVALDAQYLTGEGDGTVGDWLSGMERQELAEQVLSMVEDYERDAPARIERTDGDPAQRPAGVRATTLSFDERMAMAEYGGKAAVGDTPFYVDTAYFEAHMAGSYEARAGSAVDGSYTISREYDDLALFLELCAELKLDVMLISVPVNGWWYDYTGFSRAEREAYYDKIRSISRAHGVSLLDLSEYEYEPYFLRDIMHLGWKGWVYIEDAVERFIRADPPA